MATRNRTALFLRYRAEAQTLRSSISDNFLNDIQLDIGASTRIQEQASGPNGYMRLAAAGPGEDDTDFTLAQDYENVMGDIETVESNMEVLKKRHRDHLLPKFEEDENHQQNEADILELSKETTLLLHRCELKVRNLTKTSSVEDKDKDSKIRINMQRTLASRLQQLSTEFRSEQKAYVKNLQAQNEALATAYKTPNRTLIMLDDEPARGPSGSDTGFTKQQLLEVENAEQHIEERNREIEQIAASIQDMAIVMKDIAALVVDQGTVLDRIDYNIETASENTKKGVREMKTANRKSKKRVAFWCILCLILACGVMFVFLILKILF